MKLQIQEYMTQTPHVVTQDLPLAEAVEMMEQHHIRHLPIEYLGQLVGILLLHDAQSALHAMSAKPLKVSDIMHRHPYVVSPQTELIEVLSEMVQLKSDYAIIIEQDQILGIFTAVDGLRIFGEFLKERKSQAT